MIQVHLRLGVLVASATSMLPTHAAEQVFLQLPDEKSYGSGASISDDLYAPGGIEGVGLYIGNPNASVRNDRVLLRYDLFPLLLSGDKIERAELKFSVDYFMVPEPSLKVEIQHFMDPVEALTGQELNRSDVESAGVAEITADDTVNAADGSVRSPTDIVVDVTAAVKGGLARGLTSSVFRLRAPSIEALGNHTVRGITLTQGQDKLPVLVVTLKE